MCNRSAVGYDERMRSWLALYKYRGNEQLEPLFVDMLMMPLRMMARQLREELDKRHGTKPDSWNNKLLGRRRQLPWDAIAYVPVSDERAEERGFNQAERFAGGIAGRTGLPVVDLLVRTRHSGKQSFKTRGERIANTKQLFALAPGAIEALRNLRKPPGPEQLLSPVRLLLIDDIYTTGSTVEACSAAIRLHTPFPVAIYSLTWARS
ncbi:ComF family protein [Paenibacillus protaetiae]|uniref:ComF family protein n=1 Tax=Paenibacillus protaetiae TaxID=2509456 RepID=A0A4P6EWJ7_9BACL|nr:ComF family protein [Paenibacillus protaetiae]QAY67750.1 ComF family protein [Paenibacillus protaetiae]